MLATIATGPVRSFSKATSALPLPSSNATGRLLKPVPVWFCSIAASGCQVPLTGSKKRPRTSTDGAAYTASTMPLGSLTTRGWQPLVFSGTGVAHAPALVSKRALITTPRSSWRIPPMGTSCHATTALPLASTVRSKSSMSALLASMLIGLPHAAVAAL